MSAYDVMKVAALLGFQRRLGCDEQEAGLAAMALHPLESSHRPLDRRMEKDMRKLSRRFAKASKRVKTRTDLNELTYVVLATYAHMARTCRDPFYQPLFEAAALEAQVDLPPQRLEELKAKL